MIIEAPMGGRVAGKGSLNLKTIGHGREEAGNSAIHFGRFGPAGSSFLYEFRRGFEGCQCIAGVWIFWGNTVLCGALVAAGQSGAWEDSGRLREKTAVSLFRS